MVTVPSKGICWRDKCFDIHLISWNKMLGIIRLPWSLIKADILFSLASFLIRKLRKCYEWQLLQNVLCLLQIFQKTCLSKNIQGFSIVTHEIRFLRVLLFLSGKKNPVWISGNFLWQVGQLFMEFLEKWTTLWGI